MDTLPNTGEHPFVKAAPARRAIAAAEFALQVPPRYLSLENEQDSGQGRAIIDARAAAFRRWTVGDGSKDGLSLVTTGLREKVHGPWHQFVDDHGCLVSVLTGPAYVRYRLEAEVISNLESSHYQLKRSSSLV